MTYIDVNYIRELQNRYTNHADDIDEILNGIVKAVKNKETSYRHFLDVDDFTEYGIQEITDNLKNRGFEVSYDKYRGFDDWEWEIAVNW